MDSIAKNEIINELELAAQYIAGERTLKNIDAIRTAISSNSMDNPIVLEAFLEVLQCLTQEVKLKNTNPNNDIEILSQEEKCFLNLFYR